MPSALPRDARAYLTLVTILGAAAFSLLAVSSGGLTRIAPALAILAALAALTSAFTVEVPLASGATLLASYLVHLTTIVLYGPHAAMVVAAVGAGSQHVLGVRDPAPASRTAFDVAAAVITVQVTGQIYLALGGTPAVSLATVWVPLGAAAVTYFLVGTALPAVADALARGANPWRVWTSTALPDAAGYLLGAGAVALTLAATRASGLWPALLLVTAPLYLTYKVFQAGLRSEARQGAILEAAQDAIITMDGDGRIREFNAAAEGMLGGTRASRLGESLGVIMPEGHRETQLLSFTRYLADGSGPLAARRLEMTAAHADGSEFPVEVSVARVPGARSAGLTMFVRDIAGRRALEEQLRQSQKMEAIGRLASGVAHDFNNILTSIIGSADLLMLQLGPDHPARSEAEEIERAVERGTALSRQLLMFSRRQAAAPRRIALADVIRGMSTMLRRLIGPEVALEVTTDHSPGVVVADPAQIEQVVMNLAINARDAMANGGQLTIAVTEIATDDPVELARVEGHAGRYARVSVSDTGSGIDEKIRTRLFEPFFTTKDKGKGTGLGLTIVHGIVKQSGGFVAVESEPGHGATFHVYLPVADAPAQAPSAKG